MKEEVKSAVDFLSRILQTSHVLLVNPEQIETFNNTLQRLLRNKFENHWFPEKPFKGSGFRCIRINHKLDPLVREAGISSGMCDNDLVNIFPKELTMWVDPDDVSYRIGENGSIGLLFTTEDTNCPEQSTNNQEQQSQFNQSDLENRNFHQNQTCKEQMMSRTGISSRTIQELAPFVYS